MTSCSLTSVFGRLLLLIVNLVTGLAGLAFMFIGINGRDPSASSRNIDWSATNVALIGGAILLLSLLGIFASLLNWNLLLKGYAVILLIHVLLVTALYLYVAIFFTASVMDLAQQYFESLMVAFNEDSRAHLIVEIIQKKLLCCGSLAPADWHNVTTGNSANNLLPTGYYPASCCNGQSGFFNNFSSSLCLEKDLLFTSGTLFLPEMVTYFTFVLFPYQAASLRCRSAATCTV